MISSEIHELMTLNLEMTPSSKLNTSIKGDRFSGRLGQGFHHTH
jgi:hypothetical protein